jgi:hypothetical protein
VEAAAGLPRRARSVALQTLPPMVGA